MSLTSGTKLGPYEIVSLLGAGGMGEVWRARDVRVGRPVALKVLPEEFFESEERRARFEREARLLASLNHPGIATLYSFEEISGRHILVMELLEGETLRERLRAGPLPPRKAVDVAVQMAKALAAAHEKGIVHRDLKPENVFMTKDGRVKILDFGLAKAARAPSADGLTKTETASALSEAGTIVGTVSYMSPEQVRGEPVDHRSDIFSFGTILCEMLSEKNPFRRETSPETMAAILRDDPFSSFSTGAASPAALGRLIRHCLEKEPKQRCQSAAELAFQLEGLHSDGTETARGVSQAPSSRLRFAIWAVVAVVLAATAGAIVLFGQTRIPSVPAFTRVTFQRGFIPAARFSPDGRTIVYGAAWDGRAVQLFSTRAGGLDSRPIDIPSGDILSISHRDDLALLLRFRTDHPLVRSGTLARVPLAGGSPRELLDGVRFADWAPDGESLAVSRDVAGKVRLEFPVGKVHYETTGLIACPRISPRGDGVAFLDQPVQTGLAGQVAFVGPNGEKRALTETFRDVLGLAWSPRGDEVWFSGAKGPGGRALYAVGLTGRIRVVLSGPGVLTIHDISREGRVLLAQETARHGILARVPSDPRERELSWLDGSVATDLSTDGSVIVGQEVSTGFGSPAGIFLRRTDGTPAVRIGDGFAGKLSPDGKWIAALRLGPTPEIVALPTGPGEVRSLPRGRIERYMSVNWMPDGSRIVFSGSEKGRGPRLYLQGFDREDPVPFSPEGFIAPGSPVSPDGTLVVALGPDGSGFLVGTNGGSPRELPGLSAGEIPIRWSGDGRKLFVGGISSGGAVLRAYTVEIATGRRQLWREIVPPDPAGLAGMGPVVATPDGNVIAYSYHRFLSDLYVVEGLK